MAFRIRSRFPLYLEQMPGLSTISSPEAHHTASSTTELRPEETPSRCRTGAPAAACSSFCGQQRLCSSGIPGKIAGLFLKPGIWDCENPITSVLLQECSIQELSADSGLITRYQGDAFLCFYLEIITTSELSVQDCFNCT